MMSNREAMWKNASTALLAGLLTCGTGLSFAAQGRTAEAIANVSVDLDATQGPLLRSARYNNLSGSQSFPEQRAEDVRFFNAEGLHGSIYRVWLDDSLYDAKRGACDCDKVAPYLAQVSKLTDAILVNFQPRNAIASNESAAEMTHAITVIFTELKSRFPRIDYVEAFNEPDWNFRQKLKPADLYRYYVPFYRAIDRVNRDLRPPSTPIKVGGPALMQLDLPWLEPFIQAYAADRSPEKQLDFISYHVYGYFPSLATLTNYHFYKIDPSEVAKLRPTVEGLLRQAGLSTDIPSFITEMGIYPGPSFSDPRGHGDALRQAAGTVSLTYWLMESANDLPFNWVLRHHEEWRKDELATRAPGGRSVPTDKLTPYGNVMLMMSKMSATRVSATSDQLRKGKGVYALASKDASGVSVLVWNYQDMGDSRFQVHVRLSHLPRTLQGRNVAESIFRIDQKTSNYYADPAHANLQQVGNRTIKIGRTYTEQVDLPPNALELIELRSRDGSSRSGRE